MQPKPCLTQRDILNLLAGQQYRCALTGRQLSPDATSVDHRIPIARGGTHGVGNAWIVHSDVNRAKSTMTADEFVALCYEVVRHDRRAKLRARLERADTMSLFAQDARVTT